MATTASAAEAVEVVVMVNEFPFQSVYVIYVIKWLWCSNSCGTATELFYGSVTDTLFLHLSHEHEPTRDPGSQTHDPAMNSVTALATFDVSQFLADDVGVVPTRPDMSPTFPTKLMHLRETMML